MTTDTPVPDPAVPAPVVPEITDPGEPSKPLSITPLISHLLKDFTGNSDNHETSTTPIHVDEIASRVARFYELVRKVIDWKEDNVLRRSAIERILKRVIFSKIAGLSLMQGVSVPQVAEIVTVDLIRGGHLPNDEIPRELLPKLAAGLSKYFAILEHTTFPDADALAVKKKINFYTFILEIAACEIEEILTNPHKENSIIFTMTNIVNERIRIVPENAMTAEEKYTQTYVAVCRTLYELDDEFITYHLLKHQFPDWHTPDKEFTGWLEENILTLWSHTQTVLMHPLKKDFNAIGNRYRTLFMLIGDYLEQHKENPVQAQAGIRNRQQFLEDIGRHYDKRYASLKTRLWRLAVFSTLSVFLSNGFTFFIVEVPLAAVFSEGFSFFTALVDFVIPTVVMAILVFIIRPPGTENRLAVLKAVERLVYGNGHIQIQEIRANKKRHPAVMAVIVTIYTATTLAVFGFVGWVFFIAGLPVTSVIFDTFTIALTVFAAVTIRNKSKELSIDQKTHFWEFLLDMFSIPVAKIGSVLAAKWKEYNIIAIFFNFVIETPFAILIDFIESWSQFLKDRRAELH